MIVTRVAISNYRAIRALELQPGPGGVVVVGANARGKTTLLRAIAAAILGDDVGSDAITIGEESSEILIDLDKVYRVRRRITKNGNSLKVSSPDGSVEYKKPQGLLKDLLGASGIDPLALYAADSKERRRIVLAALPTRVSREQVQRWTEDAAYWLAEARVDLESMAGLEAISVLRAAAYERRARANKEAKDAKAKAEQAAAGLPALVDGPSVEEARTALEAADRELERLHIQNANAEGARHALAGNRRRAEERRARATAIRAGLPAPVDPAREDALAERWAAANAEVDDLKAKLRAAEERAKACHDEAKAIAKAKEEIAKGEAEAKRLEAEAAEQDGDSAAVEPVAPEVLAAAVAALQDARAVSDRAVEQEKAHGQHEVAGARRREAEAAEAHAEKLDRIVDALTKDAPAELASAGGGIPGLTIDEDGIALDGVSIDKRSGAEQLDLSVAIAKRCAGKARILLIDTLERLDGETRERFLRKATEGGWQVIGTCVRDGDVVYEAIEPGGDAGERSAAE